jgi:hypothetical protein
MIQSDPDPMAVIGHDGVILFVNPAFERLLDRTAARLVGAHFGYPHAPDGEIESSSSPAKRPESQRCGSPRSTGREHPPASRRCDRDPTCAWFRGPRLMTSPPGMTNDALRRIDALIQIGMRLACSAPSGKVLLAVLARALDPVWLPRPWGDEIAAELEVARDAACQPIDLKHVERVLRDAWGVRPTVELDELEPEPVAITPSSQVHRGILDGRPVAVKVLRPGLATSVRQDLLLVERLLSPLAAAFPAVNAKAVIAEFRERVLDELDLENESMTQRRFHRALDNHPFLMVPEPVTRLAREGVLVSEWIDGVPLTDVHDRDGAAGRLLVFMLGAARSGIVHADPDLADVLVVPNGRLAVLDFGAVRTVDTDRVRVAAAGLEAVARRDPHALGRAFDELDWLPADHGTVALDLIAHALGDLARPGPVRLDSDAVLAVRDRLFERPEALTELILAGAIPPEDLWPARGVLQLFGTIARIGATGSWLEVSQTALRDGWNAKVH